MSDMDVGSDLANEIIKQHAKMAAARGNLDSHLQEIAERVIPNHSTAFRSFSSKTKGEKRTSELFDSTAAIALNRFAAIMDSLLTPRNQTWHRMMASDPVLNKNREVKLWFEEANRILFKYRYAPRANFASQNLQNNKGLGAYGTASLFIDKLRGDDEVGLRYRDVHLGEIYFEENHQGIIDVAVRHFPLNARQAFQKWGKKLPEKIREAAKKNPEQEFFFIHKVCPNENRDPQRVDYKGMAFSDYYVSVEGKVLLEEGGFRVFPYAPSRYEQAPGETYGRSPAMDVLPAIKTLNEQKKTVLTQGHRSVNPIYLVHDDGIMDVFSAKPGAMVAGGVSADGRALVQTLPVGNIAIGKDLMDDERMVINDAFLVTLFQILVESPAMTATEVLERTREKGILLAPTFGRQQSEKLGPMIERELDLLMEQNLLPPMPEALLEAQGEYRIEYDSPLSRAQRAEEAAGLMRSVETALTVVNVTQNPAPMDHFNWDVIIPEISEIQGVPAKWMRAAEEVQAIREGRAEQAQAQQEIQAAPAQAAMIKAAAVAKKGR